MNKLTEQEVDFLCVLASNNCEYWITFKRIFLEEDGYNTIIVCNICFGLDQNDLLIEHGRMHIEEKKHLFSFF